MKLENDGHSNGIHILEVNVKPNLIGQADFNFCTTTQPKEVTPCHVLVPCQKKKNIHNYLEKTRKMLPLSPTPCEVEFPAYTVTKMTYSDRMKNQL